MVATIPGPDITGAHRRLVAETEPLVLVPLSTDNHEAAAGQREAGHDGRLRVQLLRYAGIGLVMTLAYLALYAALRTVLGPQPANLLAWALTSMADTAANRRLTFGRLGWAGALRAQLQGMLVFCLSLVLTSGALLALARLAAHPAAWVQLTLLIGSNVLAGLVRFVLLRSWVFARSYAAPADMN